MPKTKRGGPLYQRGDFRLEWDQRGDGSLRSPYLAVFWYDRERGGGRSASTHTADIEEGKAWLDAFYLKQTGGQPICPACNRPLERSAGYLVSEAITTYQTLHASALPSASAIAARLDHVVDYLEASGQANAACEGIDESWIGRFRLWSAAQPVRSSAGQILRARSLSTIEASVAQLAAVLNDAKRRRNTPHGAAFQAQSLRGLNQSPRHRASIAQLAAMLRYCTSPEIGAELDAPWGRRKEPYSEAEIIEIRRRERAALHRFLMISIATLARPDAALDFSLDPRRSQWSSNARVADLNPRGRRQTSKYRASIPIAWQLAPLLDTEAAAIANSITARAAQRPKPPGEALIAYFVGPKSIRRAWNGMAVAIGLPGDREAGSKLIRRSMADLIRQRLPMEAVGELSMFMGHDRTDPITSLYAPFSPDYLKRALAAIEGIIDEIQALAPGAFASAGGKIVSIGRIKA